jgi:hypothetical protein
MPGGPRAFCFDQKLLKRTARSNRRGIQRIQVCAPASGTRKIGPIPSFLRTFVDDDYGQKNPLRTLEVGVQANQLYDLFDVLDDRPGSPAQLADMLFPHRAEVDNNG